MSRPVRDEPKVKQWLDAVSKEGCEIHDIQTLSTVYKKSQDLLFAFLKTDVREPEGRRLPAYSFIRGHSAIIVPLAINKATKQEKFILIRQRRIGNGQDSLEFPAGMLDLEQQNPKGVAVKEMKEETGLEVNAEDFVLLNQHPLYVSPGLMDEALFYYGCRVYLTSEQWSALEGSTHGVESENEFIKVELWDEEDAVKTITSLHARMGFYLFGDYMTKHNKEQNEAK